MFIRLLAAAVFLTVVPMLQSPAPAAGNAESKPQNQTPPLVHPADQTIQSDSAIPTSLPTVAVEKIGHGVSAPVPIKTPEAKYTREAREEKIQGACIIRIIVDAAGIPQQPKVVRPLGYGLDESALAAVAKYRFKPARKEGRPVAVMIMIEVNFKL